MRRMARYETVLSRFAEKDLKEIVAYYSERDPKYAGRLFVKIRDKITELDSFPERGAIVPELEKQGLLKYRQLIEGFYRIIYTVKGKAIRILVIIDSRRNLEEILMDKLMEMSEGE